MLDVGAGAGSLGLILRRERPDIAYRFREPEPELEAVLIETFGAKSNAPSGTNFAPKVCAVFLDVIEHVPDDVALLRAVADELPPGSTIAVTVPAFTLLWSRWDTTVGHYRRYNRKQIRRVLADAGLDAVDARYIFPELFPVAVVRRVFRLGGGDFPPVARPVNWLFWTIGKLTQLLGRLTPVGTSVVAAGVTERGGTEADRQSRTPRR
ncbi:MAG: hypothetical protein QOF21_767 [Actinomycetota bacterium]